MSIDVKNTPIELLDVEIGLDHRMDSAKEVATKLIGNDIETVEDFRLLLEYRISEAKGILLFDPVFRLMTIDQLMVMHELLIQQSERRSQDERPTVDVASEKLSAATEKDKDDMFGFMDDIEKTEQENKYMQDALDFMKDGEFKDGE